MQRVTLGALASCSLLVLVAACSPNGGGTGDGGVNVLPCDGGELTLDVAAPSCLWAPDHKMVLFTKDDLQVTATGGCAVPTVSIVSVTSNQPATGGGQGNAAPDFTYNGSGVCLRSEREGTQSTPRIYTITFEATDGNFAVEKSVDVTVDRSQNGTRCPLVDSTRVVADDDSRCN